MPTKTYTKPRKTFKRKSYAKSALDRKMYQIAKAASLQVSKRQINMQFEKHYHDHSQGQNVDYNGVTVDISAITVGDNDTTRSGDRLTLKSIRVRGTVLLGSGSSALMRVMLVQCLRNDATPLAASNEVLQSSAVGSAFAPYASYAKDFAGYTWVPLYDATLSMNANGNHQQQFDIKVKPKDFKRKAKPFIQYEGGSTDGVGKIYLVYYSDTILMSSPSVNHWARIRFIDN